jgi:hypothetical protein
MVELEQPLELDASPAQARAANDLLAEIAGAAERVAPLGFVCECPDPRCSETVPLDVTQYAVLRHVWAPVRAHPKHGA